MKLTCTPKIKPISYDIILKKGLLNDPKSLCSYLKPLASRFSLISDEFVANLYGNKLVSSLKGDGLQIDLFTFPSGEAFKDRKTKEMIEDEMYAQGFGRDSCVIALGGGVATDLGGFIASTYCRGLPVVMIPTSLLGMVDASIGGKTGVNLQTSKNMLGTICQPSYVLIDQDTLSGLPISELRSGFVEMIKHGITSDAMYFDFLEDNRELLLNLEPEFMEKAIYGSCLIKKEIVEKDEKESGIRYLLNYGHTIGHAIESLTKYKISHGEAVAIGLIVEAKLSRVSDRCLKRIRDILQAYGLPLQLPKKYSFDEFLGAMHFDKKALNGKPRFAMIDEIGKPKTNSGSYLDVVEDDLLYDAITWMNHDFCCN